MDPLTVSWSNHELYHFLLKRSNRPQPGVLNSRPKLYINTPIGPVKTLLGLQIYQYQEIILSWETVGRKAEGDPPPCIPLETFTLHPLGAIRTPCRHSPRPLSESSWVFPAKVAAGCEGRVILGRGRLFWAASSLPHRHHNTASRSSRESSSWAKAKSKSVCHSPYLSCFSINLSCFSLFVLFLYLLFLFLLLCSYFSSFSSFLFISLSFPLIYLVSLCLAYLLFLFLLPCSYFSIFPISFLFLFISFSFLFISLVSPSFILI